MRHIFEELTASPLLERCLKGQNQNRNESLHAKLWLKCSKAKFAGMKRVVFACCVTVIEHNFGYEANDFLSHLGYATTPKATKVHQKLDQKRLTPRQAKKKKRVQRSSKDYQAGSF